MEKQKDLFGNPIQPSNSKGIRESKFNDYEGFVEKFKPKKTTDDCYTPAPVYEALLGYIDANVCPLEGHRIVRPFWPGAEFREYPYEPGDIVIDNPPFSILAKILDFYITNRIRFWLFAPHLTLFSHLRRQCSLICTDANITYENGAIVSTDFISNLYSNDIWVHVDGKLHDLLSRVNKQQKVKSKQNKYRYPINVTTSAELGNYIASAGAEFTILRCDAVRISKLDTQQGSAIFGGGLLLSKAKAKAKAKAKVFELSERERLMINQLG